MKSAMAKRDGDALSPLLTANFVSVDVSGQQENAAQIIAELKQLPADDARTSKTTIRSIKARHRARGTSVRYEDQKDRCRRQNTGHRTRYHLGGRLDSVKGVWLCESTSTNRLDYTVNGQAVAHRTRQ
jgi:hypothetical protein